MSYKSHDYPDRIKFSNTIMVDKDRNKGKQCLRYKLEQWKEKGTFDIMKNISEHVTLVKLMDLLGNMNHALSVVRNCIFDSNCKKTYQFNLFLF